MPREFKRTDRVGDQIQRELAWLIQRELKDPRIGMINITDVKVSRDMGYADVYITLLSTEELTAEAEPVQRSLEALRSAAGFLRNAIGKSMKLRMVPHLRFHFDALAGQSRRLDALIAKATGHKPAVQQDEAPTDDADDASGEVNS